MDVKPRLNLLFLLVAFIISSPSSAQSTAQLADPVVLTDEQNRYPLGLHLEILKDPNGDLIIQDVTRPAYQDQFIPSQEETPNFGFQDAPYWVRFQAANRSEQTSSWILELGFSNMHYMDLYLPTPDGTGYRIKESGVLRPYDSRDFPFHHLSFNLDIPPGSEQTVYIRFQNQASMTLPLQLWAPGSFFEHSLQDNLVFGAFFGILLIMAFYNASLLY